MTDTVKPLSAEQAALLVSTDDCAGIIDLSGSAYAALKAIATRKHHVLDLSTATPVLNEELARLRGVEQTLCEAIIAAQKFASNITPHHLACDVAELLKFYNERKAAARRLEKRT